VAQLGSGLVVVVVVVVDVVVVVAAAAAAAATAVLAEMSLQRGEGTLPCKLHRTKSPE
jgi:hypothetical protein